MFVRFSYWKLLPSSPCCCPWKEVTIPSSCLRSGASCCLYPRTMDLHKLFGILLHARFVFTSLIYSLNHLYQYGLMGIYCTTWVKFQFFLSLFFLYLSFLFLVLSRNIFALALESAFNWLLYPFDMAHHFMGIFSVLFFPDATRYSRLILYIPFLLKSLVPSIRETKTWIQGVLIATSALDYRARK